MQISCTGAIAPINDDSFGPTETFHMTVLQGDFGRQRTTIGETFPLARENQWAEFTNETRDERYRPLRMTHLKSGP